MPAAECESLLNGQRVEKLLRAHFGPGPGAEYAVLAVFWTRFRALLGRQSGRCRLFQQAAALAEIQARE